MRVVHEIALSATRIAVEVSNGMAEADRELQNKFKAAASRLGGNDASVAETFAATRDRLAKHGAPVEDSWLPSFDASQLSS